MFGRKKQIESKEYLELKQDLEKLRIQFQGLQLDFDLIVTKLKVKYKISSRDNKEPDETDVLKKNILLPE